MHATRNSKLDRNLIIVPVAAAAVLAAALPAHAQWAGRLTEETDYSAYTSPGVVYDAYLEEDHYEVVDDEIVVQGEIGFADDSINDVSRLQTLQDIPKLAAIEITGIDIGGTFLTIEFCSTERFTPRVVLSDQAIEEVLYDMNTGWSLPEHLESTLVASDWGTHSPITIDESSAPGFWLGFHGTILFNGELPLFTSASWVDLPQKTFVSTDGSTGSLHESEQYVFAMSDKLKGPYTNWRITMQTLIEVTYVPSISAK